MNPRDYFDSNVTGTLNVVEAVKAHKINRVVYAASSSCYGIPTHFPTNEGAPINPQYPYALSKFLGEQLLLHWGEVYSFDTISLRLFNVYGPRSRTTGAYGAVFGVFLSQKLNNMPLTVVGDGTQTRDFTYVSDVASAFLAAGQSDLNRRVFNVGSGNHYSINRLVELLGGDVVNIPKRPGEPDCTFADNSAIQEHLGWRPSVSFEDGVNSMLQNISHWKDAPVWDVKSIESATSSWFKYLGEV